MQARQPTVEDNIETVLSILSEEYTEGPAWILRDKLISIREQDCISIEWLDENVYCCVYPDEVAIDKTAFSDEEKHVVTHNEMTFAVTEPDSIRREFKHCFDRVCHLKLK